MLAEYLPHIFEATTISRVIEDKLLNMFLFGMVSITLTTLDSPSGDEYSRLRPLAYPDTDVFILLFSVVDPTSFINIITQSVPELLRHCPNTPILLCGSKVDLRDDPQTRSKLYDRHTVAISAAEGQYMAKISGCVGYIENSSKNLSSVSETFTTAVYCAGSRQENKCILS
jgi:small GTP-binding protein